MDEKKQNINSNGLLGSGSQKTIFGFYFLRNF